MKRRANDDTNSKWGRYSAGSWVHGEKDKNHEKMQNPMFKRIQQVKDMIVQASSEKRFNKYMKIQSQLLECSN